VPDHLGAAVHLDGLAALIAVHRQDREELARLRAALDEPLASGTIRQTIDDRSWGRALAILAGGDQETAFRVLSSAWQECVAGHREYCGHYLLPDLAGLAVSLGERETARQAVAELDRYTADRGGPALRRSARFATAILDGDAAALDRVAEAYAIAGRPLLEALAREHAAELLRPAGRGVGRGPGRRPAAGTRRTARDPGPAAAVHVRLGVAHPDRAEGRRPAGRRLVRPGHRGPHVHLPAHRPVPRVQHPGQARPVLPRRASHPDSPPRQLTSASAHPQR